MSWAERGQYATIVVVSFVIAAIIVKRAREWYVKPLNVEQEQVRDRAVIGEIPQTWPGTTTGEPDVYDDPVFALVHHMQIDHNASGL